LNAEPTDDSRATLKCSAVPALVQAAVFKPRHGRTVGIAIGIAIAVAIENGAVSETSVLMRAAA